MVVGPSYNNDDPDIRSFAAEVSRSGFGVETNGDLGDDTLPSRAIEGQINSFTDVDFFSVNLLAGETLILDMDQGSLSDGPNGTG